jgi:hypothetical protein
MAVFSFNHSIKIMKAPFIIKSVVIGYWLILSIPVVMLAQDATNKKNEKAEKVRSMVTAQRYVFNAETVTALAGRIGQLTGGYELRVTKDTISAYLPYFGKAYVAPINPSEGGINFTSLKFGYEVTERKKGGWEITIKPQDVQDPRQLNLFISENGYAVLQVTSNNRQAISFNGSIVPVKNK